MATRFRRSVKILPGVKLNIGKKSASVTMGGKFFRQTIGTNGRVTKSASLPGTGIYWTESHKPQNQRRQTPIDERIEAQWFDDRNDDCEISDVPRSASKTAIVCLVLCVLCLCASAVGVFLTAFTDVLRSWLLGPLLIGALVFAVASWALVDMIFDGQ